MVTRSPVMAAGAGWRLRSRPAMEWTDQETTTLISLWPTHSAAQIAARLQCSREAVTGKPCACAPRACCRAASPSTTRTIHGHYGIADHRDRAGSILVLIPPPQLTTRSRCSPARSSTSTTAAATGRSAKRTRSRRCSAVPVRCRGGAIARTIRGSRRKAKPCQPSLHAKPAARAATAIVGELALRCDSAEELGQRACAGATSASNCAKVSSLAAAMSRPTAALDHRPTQKPGRAV
jgi:hypothetical protein